MRRHGAGKKLCLCVRPRELLHRSIQRILLHGSWSFFALRTKSDMVGNRPNGCGEGHRCDDRSSVSVQIPDGKFHPPPLDFFSLRARLSLFSCSSCSPPCSSTLESPNSASPSSCPGHFSLPAFLQWSREIDWKCYVIMVIGEIWCRSYMQLLDVYWAEHTEVLQMANACCFAYWQHQGGLAHSKNRGFHAFWSCLWWRCPSEDSQCSCGSSPSRLRGLLWILFFYLFELLSDASECPGYRRTS